MMWKITHDINVILPVLVSAVSFTILKLFNAYSYSTDRFILGNIVSTLFISSAVDTLYTAALANCVCVLEQTAADSSAVQGSPEASRERNEIELEALAMLGSSFNRKNV